MMDINIHSHLHQAVNVAYRLNGGEGVTDVVVIKPRRDDSLAEHVDAVLSRFTVFDLREVAADEMERAVDRLERGEGFIAVYKSGERNLIGWYQVASNEHFYEIRRFETFWFCSCPGFTFSKTCCKHIAFIHSQQKGKVKYGKSTDSSNSRKGTDLNRLGTGETHGAAHQADSALAG